MGACTIGMAVRVRFYAAPIDEELTHPHFVLGGEQEGGETLAAFDGGR